MATNTVGPVGNLAQIKLAEIEQTEQPSLDSMGNCDSFQKVFPQKLATSKISLRYNYDYVTFLPNGRIEHPCV